MIPDNLCIHYYDNGSVSEMYEFNEHGSRHGIHVDWDISGICRQESHYVNGERHGKYRDWYVDGQLWEECIYVNNHMQGIRFLWHENGQMWEESYWEHGQMQGACKRWDHEGNIRAICNYVNGNRHGLYYYWTAYNKGRLIKYFASDIDVTDQVAQIVKDISSITDQEKIQLNLMLGVIV